ncbi:MAG: ABC transporter permease [Smithellaceae bacterium]|nr:ABC transporter permease [Smithellaceae bacterium]
MHRNHYQELSKDRWFIVGSGLAFLLALVFLAGPSLIPYDPHDMSYRPLSPPSGMHWLGVNDGGMDILAELIEGGRHTVAFGLQAGAAGLFLGVLAGLAAAWRGGWPDLIIMRLAEIMMSIPPVMVLILAAAFFRPSPSELALTLACLSWPTTAKVIRSQALVVRQSLHVEAARRMGGTNWYILARHLLPELFPLYLMGFVNKLRMAMFMEASLAFLGLFDPSRKTLGMMIRYALKYYYLDTWWHWILPPIICLTLIMAAVTFLAISLEKLFHPRLKEL